MPDRQVVIVDGEKYDVIVAEAYEYVGRRSVRGKLYRFRNCAVSVYIPEHMRRHRVFAVVPYELFEKLLKKAGAQVK